MSEDHRSSAAARPDSLLQYDLPGLEREVERLGMARYRARQLWDWVFRRQVVDFAAMTNLSKTDRAKLAERFPTWLPSTHQVLRDADGTVKLGLPCADGALVETVAIPDPEGAEMTFCVSSQSGCPVGCVFCRTGAHGPGRNLAAHEIVAQVVALGVLVGRKPAHVVFMGMGEPMLNRSEVLAAIRLLTDPAGFGLASRRLTVSTIGHPDGIRAMVEWPGEVNLAVSLHSAVDSVRRQLVPGVRFSVEAIRQAVTDYTAATGRRVTFEVVLVANVNDGEADALNLAAFCTGLLCHVNLIPVNPIPGSPWRPPVESAVKTFQKCLKREGVAVTVRQSRGGSILAACGQLAGGTAGSS